MSKKKEGQWSLAKACALTIVIIMLWFAFFGENGFVDMIKLQKTKQELEAKVAEFAEQNRKLRNEIEALNDEENKEVERIARKDFNMVRDGEIVYQFRSEEVAEGADDDQSKNKQKGEGEKQ